MERLFGTDGVRGVAGQELSATLAYELGRAGAYVLSGGTHRPKILVGRDTRISGQMLQSALGAGICSVGGDVILVGELPTPAIAWLTRHYKADAGVMISASHNPMEDNGIKFFSGDGYKLPDATEEAIEEIVRGGGRDLPCPTGADIGRMEHLYDAAELYADYLAKASGTDLTGMTLVLDCANGAASAVAPKLFKSMGAKVIALHACPDGLNINAQCGSTHMESLKAAVPQHGADIGLAFDGDADRMLAVDADGCEVDGDAIMAICAVDRKAQGALAHDTLVVTVMSNLGLKLAMERCGINIAETQVGDRYVLECMREHGYVLGGEQSGHVIHLDSNTTGDGINSALQLLGALKRSGKSLKQAAQVMRRLPQVLVNLRLEDNSHKALWEKNPIIADAIARLEGDYAGRGRILVRASGTEPLIRVMIEGEDEEQIERDAQALAKLIKDAITKSHL